MSKAFMLDKLEDGVVLVRFDRADEKVNTFSQEVLGEFKQWIEKLRDREGVRGLLLISGKPGQFIAGADLKELGALAHATEEQVDQAIAFGHDLFQTVSDLPFPTVALIEGHCMGGGTELVLSMDERIVADTAQTQIALPEVKVGVIPGWGGTQRLPRLVGIQKALEMITTGKPVDGHQAAKIGLAFDVVPADRLIEEGQRWIAHAHETGAWQASRKRRSAGMGLSDDQLAYAFDLARAFTLDKTKGQYPAPMVAIEAMEAGINLPLSDGLTAERAATRKVFGSPVAANLIAIFFHSTQLKSDPGVDDRSIGPQKVGRVGVIGAGLMGAGIATACARRGVSSTMMDLDDQRLDKGMAAARKVVESRIKIGRATPKDMAAMLSHLGTTTDTRALVGSDVVVEAVTENMALKQKVFAGLKEVLGPQTILASNTSTLSITKMAEHAPDPSRFVGMHFFSPVDRMELVEVIRGQATSDQTVATVVALAKRIGKTPIVVKDCPGFAVNRLLMPYMAEALVLLSGGIDMDRIDRVATRFGMPVGPIALYDMVGIDVGYYAGGVMAAGYADRAVALPPVLKALMDAGRLGKKSGSGFRAYDKKGKPVSDPDVLPILEAHTAGHLDLGDEQIADRLFGCMALEAARAMEEGVVRTAGHLDMAMILGTGFPPFRGGPLKWMDDEGAEHLLARLKPYAELGKRFEPPPSLIEMARSGATYHPSPKTSGGA